MKKCLAVLFVIGSFSSYAGEGYSWLCTSLKDQSLVIKGANTFSRQNLTRYGYGVVEFQMMPIPNSADGDLFYAYVEGSQTELDYSVFKCRKSFGN